VFQPLLQEDVGRTSRLNIMKLIPSLNMFVKLTEQQRSEQLEGLLIIPVEFSELPKFRYHRMV